MSLLERIDGDLKKSMKARDAERLSAIRMLKAGIKNRQIERGSAFSEDDILSVISSMMKQRRESVEQYAKAGRADLATKEEAEMHILEGYLPEQLSDEEVVKIIREAIAEASATSARDMGRVMKLVMPRVKGRADGKFVNEKAKELLGG